METPVANTYIKKSDFVFIKLHSLQSMPTPRNNNSQDVAQEVCD